ncbi:UDP-N-acetylglucosamine 2-epimerase [candidate division WOR-3 bacterium]|nr:UDP-N-acetylglucosamine 2-epimerase [candidate division WOR-3 bacterium]
MIHIFVGTKAQSVKMAPIIQELDQRSIKYNFIDSGQHAVLTDDLIQQFGLRKPDIFLRKERTNINTIPQAISWTAKSAKHLITKREEILKVVFRGKRGICLIHGDTLSTLISLLYAKRCGVKIAHVEAGLRSYRIFNPFPEEIIRLLVMRLSDILFAPSDWSYGNLKKMGYAHKSINVHANTIVDTIRFAKNHIKVLDRPSEPYVIATIHRVETIYSRTRLSMIAALLDRIAQDRKVIFVVHEPTQHQLSRFGLITKLQQNSSIEIMPLQPYLLFLNLLAGADFVVTDGGSIQEETFSLNIPCLIMRSKTERKEGLEENACLAEFNEAQINYFFKRLPMLRRKNADQDLQPSRLIVDRLLSWV